MTLEHDYGMFGAAPAGEVLERWDALVAALPVRSAVHARQVHEATVRAHGAGEPGVRVAPACDGHLTDQAGVLLVVSVADCVPVYLVAPGERVVGMVHAGWRSTAGGILEEAVAKLGAEYGVRPESLHMHLGPSICGACYEVGPEVFEAVGEPIPGAPTPIDLPANLVRRARRLGLAEDRISRSGHCTKCGELPLFSHRAGSPARQMAFLGVAE
jgi:YfiH family protein